MAEPLKQHQIITDPPPCIAEARENSPLESLCYLVKLNLFFLLIVLKSGFETPHPFRLFDCGYIERFIIPQVALFTNYWLYYLLYLTNNIVNSLSWYLLNSWNLSIAFMIFMKADFMALVYSYAFSRGQGFLLFWS